MKKVLYVLSTMLMLTVIIIGATMGASAEDDVIHSGTWGDLSWELNENTGHLTISGSGEMDYFMSASMAWRVYGTSIQSVTIGEGITNIGSYAFQSCTNLKSVVMPQSMISIDSAAFVGCSGLVNIKIPNGVKSIGNAAFQGCSSLTSVIFDKESQLITIDLRAFYNCDSLHCIEIPSGVTSIGGFAFYSCDKLTSITFVDNSHLKEIGGSAFKYCESLNAVYITDIAAWCELSFSAHEDNPLYYAKNLYLNGSLLTDLIIPESTRSIGSYVFCYYDSLMEVNVPSSVTYIGDHAFAFCSNLTQLTFSDSSQLTSISAYAFCECINLTSIEIPNNVTDIGQWAFAYCSGLKSVTFGEKSHLTHIGDYAFQKCSNLTGIAIPANVAEIGLASFAFCSNMTSISFATNSKLVSIGGSAFRQCGFSSIIIPNGVTIIESGLFRDCSKLTSIIIPKSVVRIDSEVIYNCLKLKNITYCGIETQWNAIEKNSDWNYYSPKLAVQYHNVHEWGSLVSNGHMFHTEVCIYCGEQGACEAHVFDSDGDMICDACGFNAVIVFEDSMQAYLNLESEVNMSVGYKIEGMDSFDWENLIGRFGLLIWNADNMPLEATFDNCGHVLEGAYYNPEKGRFETTTDGIPAKNLGDLLCFRAYFINKDGSYSYSRLITDYSPKVYCYKQIANNPSDEKLIHLMASILNYGAAAQLHFDYNVEDLMNAGLSEELKAMDWDGSLVRADYSIADGKDSAFVRDGSIVSRGGYLDLEGSIDYNFYAKVDFDVQKATIYYWTEADVLALDALTLENASSSETMTWEDGKARWEGCYEGQAAKRMFQTVYACMVFEDAEGNMVCSGVIGYSPERYAYINQNNGDTNAELAKRMVVYGDAARAYFE